MRVLVTGASGYIGVRLVTALSAGGHEVVACGLPGSENTIPPFPGTAAVGLDLADLGALAVAARGAEVVYHLAGVLPGSSVEQFRRANVQGTMNVAAAAADGGARRVVFLSSTAVYRPSPYLWPLTEDAPLNDPGSIGARGYGESKVAAERVLKSAADTTGFEVAILRASTVYGPDSRSLQLLLGLINRPFLGVRPGSREPTTQWLFVDDLVDALQSAGERPAAARVTVNVAGGELTSLLDLVAAARSALGQELEAPLPRTTALRFSFAAAARVLGFAPTPLRTALRASLSSGVPADRRGAYRPGALVR